MVSILKELDTSLPFYTTLDWIGCPVVPDKILESIQGLKTSLDGTWVTPLSTETMTAISQIYKVAGTIRVITEPLRVQENVTAEDLERLIDEF